jgi:putative endonuclease
LNYFLYILKSQKVDKYYTGISSDPERRLIFHNSIEKGFTARYRPWQIVLKLEFDSEEIAFKMEKKIKRMKSKAYIKKIISVEYKLS